MARMPNAVWKPLPRPSSTRMARYDLVVIHTMVGSLAGTDGYFRRLTNGVNSHFGTGGGGEIWQWVDTAVRSGANGAGNHRCITIENADMGPGFAAWNTSDGSAVPAFTSQQLEANAQICAWAYLAHGVPLVAADTSRPSARGIGYHRLGCNPWRVPDGELWSSSTGKVCPGNRRIAQIPQIIARARQIVAELNGAPPARPAPQEDDMFEDGDRKLLRDLHMMMDALKGGREKAFYQPFFAEAASQGTAQQIAALTGSLNAIAEALRNGGTGDGFTVDEAVAAGRAGAEAALAELGDKLRTQP